MASFGGFPKEYKSMGYGKLKKFFDDKFKEKCPDAAFDKEAAKIEVYPPKKKLQKEE